MTHTPNPTDNSVDEQLRELIPDAVNSIYGTEDFWSGEHDETWEVKKGRELYAKLNTLIEQRVVERLEAHTLDCISQYASTKTVSCFEYAKSIFDKEYSKGLAQLQAQQEKESDDE